MQIILIVAYSQNRAIGKDNKLLWHLGEDMAFFKEKTMHQIVLMGKNTYLSLPPKFRPLPHRTNVVISSQPPLEIRPNLEWFSSLDKALDELSSRQMQEVFIIGGAIIYEQMLPLAHKILATEVKTEIVGDAYFPKMDASFFDRKVLKTVCKDDKHDFDFEIVEYTRKEYCC